MPWVKSRTAPLSDGRRESDVMKRVLVVDDEPPIRQVIGALFHQHGYDVVYAESGFTALRILGIVQPQLIMLDMTMSDGGGWDALHAIESQPELCDIPVIVVSTAVANQRIRMLSVPVIEKPFDLDQLLDMVVETIGPAWEPDQSPAAEAT
jgi:CheY-like chemotaxis protein